MLPFSVYLSDSHDSMRFDSLQRDMQFVKT